MPHKKADTEEEYGYKRRKCQEVCQGLWSRFSGDDYQVALW